MKQLKINNRFVTQKKISQGSFGIVMQGLDQQNGDTVAIKIERPENEQTHSIDREVDILSKLNGVQGVPKMLYYGWEDNCNVIVLELLSKDLSSLIKSRKKFTLKTTLQISIELVQILARVHERGVLHRDLKPENMMLDETNNLYLIDFGISKIYIRKNGIMIPFKDRVSFVGTSRYASIAAHKGYELARKDDLESLLYVMLYFVKGNLPWQNLKHVADEQRTLKIGEMKENIDVRELFRELPSEFQKIYEYLRKLAYTSEPDYKTIVKLLQQAAKNSQIILDYKYDWDQQVLEKDMSRCGTLPVETLPMKQFEKFASNVHRSSNFVAQTPSKFKQLQPPIMKQDSNQNSGSGSGNNNLSIYNSMGMFFQMSMDEISEETLDSIPDEKQASLKLNALPDHLKKPTQESNGNIEEDNVVYNRMQSLSAQVTQIFHYAHK